MNQIPPPPPATIPAKKGKHPYLLAAGAVFLGLLIMGNITDVGQEERSDVAPVDVPAPTGQDYTLTLARVAWDTALTESDRQAICDYYNTPPVGMTPVLVREFAEGADISYAEADQVLGDLLAEEC